MRAKDFIGEAKKGGKIRKAHKAVSQGSMKMRDVGGYDRTYHLNRIMMAAGMADGTSSKPVDMDSSSWYEKYNTAHPYTDEEYMMMKSAFNTVPTDGCEVDKRHKSKEPNTVHKVSPVPDRNTLSETANDINRVPDHYPKQRPVMKMPGMWKWDKDDIVMSPKTGRTFVILGRQFDKAQNQAVYLYRSKDGKGVMPVSTAHKTLMKINEAATVGATSSGSIATVSNPHISPGKARGKKSYTGSPGKSGTSAPAQPKPKKQSPSDNALNIKGTSLFGGPAIKR